MWKEPFDSIKHGLPDGLSDAVELPSQHRTATTLIAHDVIFVSICSFTFQFHSRAQLERVPRYYEQKCFLAVESQNQRGRYGVATTNQQA